MSGRCQGESIRFPREQRPDLEQCTVNVRIVSVDGTGASLLMDFYPPVVSGQKSTYTRVQLPAPDLIGNERMRVQRMLNNSRSHHIAR